MLIKPSAIAVFVAAPFLAVAQSGCAPKWRSGSDYILGSVVSAVIEATAGGSGSQPSRTSTHNFRCTHGVESHVSHCPTYDPSNTLQASAAWDDLGVCSGDGPAPVPVDAAGSPVPPLWRGVGCPPNWQNGASYNRGDTAEVDGIVYECSSEMFVNTWCGLSDYKPGDSLYWSQAWKELGSCSGFITPTTSPAYVSLTETGGCPEEFQSGADYKAGDTVTVEANGVAQIVYQCDALNAAYCDQFPPGNDSKLGWKVLGYCSGKIL